MLEDWKGTLVELIILGIPIKPEEALYFNLGSFDWEKTLYLYLIGIAFIFEVEILYLFGEDFGE